jgi:hypothetical protein
MAGFLVENRVDRSREDANSFSEKMQDDREPATGRNACDEVERDERLEVLRFMSGHGGDPQDAIFGKRPQHGILSKG